MIVSRRKLITAISALSLAKAFAFDGADITVGITVDTRPDWNGPEHFVRSIQEASADGYHWIETFWQYVAPWETKPEELKEMLDKLNLRLETVSNGGNMRTDFGDASQRQGVIEDHMKLVRFIQKFGCDHLKINCGSRVSAAPVDRAKLYKQMSATFDEIGRRMNDLGMKFAVHAHLGSNLQTREDVDAILEETNPKYVYFVLDTGHITMAGMDPVELTRAYQTRIIEYHLKDVDPKNRGGYKGPELKNGTYNTNPDNVIFFPLGKGGVDFPQILSILNANRWKGWFTVELDRTTATAKHDAATSKSYLENVLHLKV
ncbi:MAG: TIM barrel protein [Acidobacteriaceae bacterium]|nr:TIM barrel protein [Acidobacteriaceae bacterium]